MLKEWKYQTSTGVVHLEAVEHNDEIKFNLKAYDKYEDEFEELLINKEDLIKLRNMIDQAINLK